MTFNHVRLVITECKFNLLIVCAISSRPASCLYGSATAPQSSCSQRGAGRKQLHILWI